jgi:hypothetical protein
VEQDVGELVRPSLDGFGVGQVVTNDDSQSSTRVMPLASGHGSGYDPPLGVEACAGDLRDEFVAELATGEQWQRYLSIQARFHGYSFCTNKSADSLLGR